MSFNTQEVAFLRVNGVDYYDWTSIMVEVRLTDYFPIFEFECTEFVAVNGQSKSSGISIGTIRNNLKIVPGDIVELYLGGTQVVLGYVTERHVAFDANNHGVRIVGVGKTADLVSSSVWSQGGSYDNQSWSQLARALIAPHGIKLVERGALDRTPYEHIHVQPGEIIASALERYARQRNIVIGSTHDGNLLGIGDHAAVQSGMLVEGVNILSASAVIKDDNVYKRIYAFGQRSGNDNVWGDRASKLVGYTTGSSRRERTRVVPMEVSDDQHGAQQLAEMEKVFTEGGSLEERITVQGWFREGANIWRAGEYYWVRSEMLITDMLLGCKSIVYEQSTYGGTKTTLSMVDPFHMKGRPDFSGTTPKE
ncbi:phage baseplate assembly protein [Bradyrhizobium sp. SZCCHNS3051]|uniref:phage baseplate assembly protein n=1 Tax=Bradyrhizobium sp. SZCCHNS3051 TaxID=3057320 RepID=UPI002916624D|nr:hypothetical protein [Bradyrhizobium sp. SZCCHNS3051]